MRTLVIIPCYNEEKSIVKTVRELKAKTNFDYIIVNDGSTDNSLDIIRKNKLNYINLDNNLGIGGAMQTGYKYAYNHNYDIAVQLDGDGQHNPAYIKKIVEEIENGTADMVIGSRFVGNKSEFKSSQIRRVGIKLLSSLVYIMTKYKILDITSGFRAVNKKIIKLFVESYPEEYPEPVTDFILANQKYKIKEIAVSMNERKYGKSSIRKFKSIYYMINVILLFILEKVFKGGKSNA